jgi:hypothetical protein
MAIMTSAELATYLGVSTNANTAIAALWAQRAAEEYVGYELERQSILEYYPQAGERHIGDRFVDEQHLPSRPCIDKLYLRGRPVVSAGLVVHEDRKAYAGQGTDPFPASTLLTLGEDYILDRYNSGVSRTGKLVRLTGGWSDVSGSIQVTYTFGYTANELAGDISGGNPDFRSVPDIMYALQIIGMKSYNELIAHQASDGTPGPIVSESLEGYSYTLDSSAAGSLFGLTMAIPAMAAQILYAYKRMMI